MRFLTTNLCTESQTTMTALTSDINFPVINLKNPFRSKCWRSTDVNDQTIVFDFKTTESVNSVIILWPKETPIKLSESAVLKIQANATNEWTSPALDQSLSINFLYQIASHYFTSDQNYRYWRVVVDDPSSDLDYVEIGMVWIGKSLDITNAENGFIFNLDDPSKVNTTDYGHQYVDEYPIMATLSFSYKSLYYEEIQILENAFRLNGIKKPVIIALDESSLIFNKDHFVVYGKLKPNHQNKHLSFNLFDSGGMTVEELS